MKYPTRLIIISTAVTNNLRRISLLKNDSAALLRTELRRTKSKNLFLNILLLDCEDLKLLASSKWRSSALSSGFTGKTLGSWLFVDVDSTFTYSLRTWSEKLTGNFWFALEKKGLFGDRKCLLLGPKRFALRETWVLANSGWKKCRPLSACRSASQK